MGTDDIHYKRKARKSADLNRKRARKNPYQRILVVCEGEVTEINYFSALIEDLRLTTANAVAVPSPSTCPEANVLHGIAHSQSGDWDIVFCVFDKDKHGKYQQALNRLGSCSDVVRPGYSVPCFEYWLLLHFTYTDRSFYGHPTLSAGSLAERELKKHIPDYSKGSRDIYSRTKGYLEKAKKFAVQANRSAASSDANGSHTLVVDVVRALQDLRVQMDA